MKTTLIYSYKAEWNQFSPCRTRHIGAYQKLLNLIKIILLCYITHLWKEAPHAVPKFRHVL